MDITIVTTATDDASGKALLDAFGFPFARGEADVPRKERRLGPVRGVKKAAKARKGR
jgi:large subunit ribosomal protein L5